MTAESKVPDFQQLADGFLSIEKASSLRDSLLRRLSEDAELVLDLSTVEDIDLSCFQVLVAAFRFAGDSGRSFRLTGVLKARLARRLGLCGLIVGVPSDGGEVELALKAAVERLP